jgi:hypothetical protein
LAHGLGQRWLASDRCSKEEVNWVFKLLTFAGDFVFPREVRGFPNMSIDQQSVDEQVIPDGNWQAISPAHFFNRHCK